MNLQPNFELVKQKVYDYIKSLPDGNLFLLGKEFKLSHYQKRKEFITEMNIFLDRLDIREVPAIVKELKNKGVSFPKWISQGNYTIDYNKNDCLDLIKTISI